MHGEKLVTIDLWNYVIVYTAEDQGPKSGFGWQKKKDGFERDFM